MKPADTAPFWSLQPEALLADLGSSASGLSSKEARERLCKQKPQSRATPAVWELFNQFKSPIILILLFAAGLSALLQDESDAAIIIGIVLGSGLLGFWQEHRAGQAVQRLLALVKTRATVLRDGSETELSVEEVVPGDIVVLNAGDLIPGDALILESNTLFVDESALTGESYAVEKMPGISPADATAAQRPNALFMGSHVVSGSARALIALVGEQTIYGKVSARLKTRPSETDFERGVRRFGFFLLELTLMLVIAIFAINVHFQRPVLEAFLFALALAVGLTPQLLPAVIAVNLAYGARAMAARKVIVKRLASIENLGSMNVLCADKTGTLTLGQVRLRGTVDSKGRESREVLCCAALNALHQKGFSNPIDKVLSEAAPPETQGFRKLGEIPYDFSRKRVSVLVQKDDKNLLITKGAMPGLLQACAYVQEEERLAPIAAANAEILEQARRLGSEGFRVLGVAKRDMGNQNALSQPDESGMTFLGFVLLFDPPKPGIADVVRHLKRLGISLKIITGDNAVIAERIGQQVGMNHVRILRGPEVERLSEAALRRRVERTDVFAEIEPNTKERLILALRRGGNVVGYMGDGINDAAALHAADVSLSVNGAVDVAREAADIVLLEKDLGVLVAGVEEGRRTFANTLKYVFMATSANFGNMFSMAGASLFLPFLPLLPKQILLTNVLTDLPEMAIPTDNVSPELIQSPRRWDLKFIRRFMLTFGLVSSLFDFLTFAVLLFILRAGPAEFRTGWFVESVVSASLIVLVIRVRRPFYKSWPSTALLAATLAVVVGALLLPYSGFAQALGFVPLPAGFLAVVLLITTLYVAAAETAKRSFYRHLRP